MQNGITRRTTEKNTRKKTRIQIKICYRLERVRREMYVHPEEGNLMY
jgi:hypothetical protein